MGMRTHIAFLEAEWKADRGVLWRARHGVLDREGCERLRSGLAAMPAGDLAETPSTLRVAGLVHSPVHDLASRPGAGTQRPC